MSVVALAAVVQLPGAFSMRKVEDAALKKAPDVQKAGETAVETGKDWVGYENAGTVNERLLLASKKNDFNRVKELIAAKADVNYEESVGDDEVGYTPLMYASLNHNVEMVKVLLAAGADKNHYSKSGNRALTFSNSEELDRLLRPRENP